MSGEVQRSAAGDETLTICAILAQSVLVEYRSKRNQISSCGGAACFNLAVARLLRLPSSVCDEGSCQLAGLTGIEMILELGRYHLSLWLTLSSSRADVVTLEIMDGLDPFRRRPIIWTSPGSPGHSVPAYHAEACPYYSACSIQCQHSALSEDQPRCITQCF